MSPLTISDAEAAEQLGVSVGTVYQMCARGDLRAARVGRRYLIPRQEVGHWLMRASGINETVEAAGRRYDAIFSSVIG